MFNLSNGNEIVNPCIRIKVQYIGMAAFLSEKVLEEEMMICGNHYNYLWHGNL